jgi:GntR family transcriptional regulator
MIGVVIDKNSLIPIYAQIVQQVKFGIALGRLKPGDPLPSIRELAADLLINPNTVARAYRELEGSDLLHTQKGKGCYIAENLPSFERKIGCDEIFILIDKVKLLASSLGLDRGELLEIIKQRLKVSMTVERDDSDEK